MLPNFLRIFNWLLVAIALGVVLGLIGLANADGPVVIIAPNGAITYVYPGANGLPTVAMPPSTNPTAGITYLWPGVSAVPSPPTLSSPAFAPASPSLPEPMDVPLYPVYTLPLLGE